MIILQVATHSGDIDTVEVEEYDAESIADLINNHELNVIVLGNNIYSKIDIKSIKVTEQVE